MRDPQHEPIDAIRRSGQTKPPDYYGILKVDREATPAAIKVAYHWLCFRLLLPWITSAETAAHLEWVRAAYAVLSDPVRRAEYDHACRLAGRWAPSPVAPATMPAGPDRLTPIQECSVGESWLPSNGKGPQPHHPASGLESQTGCGSRPILPNRGRAVAIVADTDTIRSLDRSSICTFGDQLERLLLPLKTLGLLTERSLVFGLMIVCLFAQGINMLGYPASIAIDDEGTYVALAWSVVTQGQLDHYTYTYGHVPGGWILLAVFMLLSGGPHALEMPVNSGRLLMLILHVAMVPLLYRLARKLGCPAPAAGLASFLFSVSPLAIFYQRPFLLDSVMLFWILVSLFLVLDSRGRLSRVVISGFCFGLALLSKEPAIFLLPAMLYVAWRWRQSHHGRFAVVGWLLPMGIVTSWYVLLATLKGELLPAGFTMVIFGLPLRLSTSPHVSLLESLLWQAGRGGGGIFDLQNQFWWNVRNVWLPQDNLLVGGGMAAILLNLLRGIRSHRVFAAGLLGLMPLLYLGRGGIVFGFYILFALPFLCLNLAVACSPLFAYFPARPASILALLVAGFLLARYWQAGTLQSLYTVHADQTSRVALAWLKHNLSSQATIITRDTFWTDIHDPELGGPAFPNVHEYWHVGSDPAVRYGIFHDDWRTVDYLLMLPDMLDAFRTSHNTLALDAYSNSCLLKKWVDDNGTDIELWRVDKSGASAGKPYTNQPTCEDPAHSTGPQRPANRQPGEVSADRSEPIVALLHHWQAYQNVTVDTPHEGATRGRDGAPLPRIYEVRPGDTLTDIAARVYGNGAAWPQIVAANPGQIADPNQIFPGERLVLPRQP